MMHAARYTCPYSRRIWHHSPSNTVSRQMTQSEEGSRYEGVGGIGVNVGGEGMTSDGDVEDKGYDDDEEEEGHEDDHDKSL